MSEAVERFLRTHADEFAVGQQLHDVPPHLVYEVTFEGQRAVCKVSTEPRGHAGVEGRVQRYVDRETAVPTPKVLTVGADGYVAGYDEDAPREADYEDRELTGAWLRAAGRTLARLHGEVTFDRPGLLAVDGDPADPTAGLCVDSPPDATWADALDSLLAVYGNKVRGTGFEATVAEARSFVDEHAAEFDAHGEAALLHGWFTPEHAEVRDGETRCVVDFEHALVGSPAWDYWRTAVPLFLGDGWEKPDDAEAAFRSAYESVRPLPTDLDTCQEAYVGLVSVSYLDSLHTQTGIDEETEERAEWIASTASEQFDAARNAFAE